MRADEYIVELLNKKEQEYNTLFEEYQKLTCRNNKLENKLTEVDNILASIKQNLVIQTVGDVSTIKYTFVEQRHKSKVSRIIAFNDEPLFTQLISILGPLNKEETKDE